MNILLHGRKAQITLHQSTTVGGNPSVDIFVNGGLLVELDLETGVINCYKEDPFKYIYYTEHKYSKDALFDYSLVRVDERNQPIQKKRKKSKTRKKKVVAEDTFFPRNPNFLEIIDES
ncbi:MAG: hypothetical protein WC525_10310 [Candidatus Thermoplasmatota archaeon]